MTSFEPSGNWNYEELAVNVHRYIKNGYVRKVRSTLSMPIVDDRKKIVNHKIDGNAALFIACQEGHVDIVTFLLDECETDIELKGVYMNPDTKSPRYVSPLHCAAIYNKLDVLKVLVQRGADINSTSNTDTTPILSACFEKHIDVVKYLHANGADILKSNVYYTNCLMVSTKCPELCQFMLDKGFDVNLLGFRKHTALHNAVLEDALDCVKLLIRNGADFTLQNEAGDDALQTAALRGNKDIVDVILKEGNSSDEHFIRAYELLGTSCLDGDNDTDSAVALWKESMNVRYRDKTAPILKGCSSERKHMYQFAKEIESYKELESLQDKHEIYTQAMLIRERILGTSHEETSSLMVYRGAVYADERMFSRAVELWKYTYTLQYQVLGSKSIDSVERLVNLFWELYREIKKDATDERIQIDDVIDVLELLTEQSISVHRNLKLTFISETDRETHQIPGVDDQKKPTVYDLEELLMLYIHLINLFTNIGDSSEEDKVRYIAIVQKMVKSDLRCADGRTLLHLAVDPNTSMVKGEFFSQLPSPAVVITLITCGANTQSICDGGNIPLVHASMHLVAEETLELKLVCFILLIVTNIIHLFSRVKRS